MTHTIKILFVSCVAITVATVAGAAIIPLSPVGGAEVSLVPDAQKKVMSPLTLAERIAIFREDREKNGKVIRHDKFWRKPAPLVLKWRTTGKENQEQ